MKTAEEILVLIKAIKREINIAIKDEGFKSMVNVAQLELLETIEDYINE